MSELWLNSILCHNLNLCHNFDLVCHAFNFLSHNYDLVCVNFNFVVFYCAACGCEFGDLLLLNVVLKPWATDEKHEFTFSDQSSRILGMLSWWIWCFSRWMYFWLVRTLAETRCCGYFTREPLKQFGHKSKLLFIAEVFTFTVWQNLEQRIQSLSKQNSFYSCRPFNFTHLQLLWRTRLLNNSGHR